MSELPSNSLPESKSRQTSESPCLRSKTKTFINFSSHLLLPLTMGIFTVTFTIYQQRITNEQRLEDRTAAREQREQDLNISAIQREQDKLIARLQREEDELRRAQDLNISAMRRDLDLHIAEMKQQADNINAEKQRNMSREQREHEIEFEQKRHLDNLAQRKHEIDMEQNRYLDGLLLSYINEVGTVLRSINGSLISKRPTEAALVRAKTLNVLSQLDSTRALQLIYFLYNAEQLTINNGPLDLTGAHLNGINLQSSPRMPAMKKLSLRQTFLINARFEGQDVSFWDFTGAQLTGANFFRANCTQAKFEQATLVNANFSQSILTSVKFIFVNLNGANFYKTKATKLIFDHAKMEKTNFADAVFHGGFQKPPNIRFFQSNIVQGIFTRAVMFHIRFNLCDMRESDFSYSYLLESQFFATTLAFASFINANLSTTRWYYANMSYANLSGADCTYACELDETLSLHNTILPNNTLGKARKPLLSNSKPKCEQKSVDGWVIQNGRITVQDHPYKEDAKNGICVFAPLSMEIDMKSPSMTQQIDVRSYESLISEGFSQLSILACIGMKTTLRILQYNMQQKLLDDSTWSIKGGTEKADTVFKQILLNQATHFLQVDVQFSAHFSITYSWIEYIELHIDPFYEPLD